VRDGQNEFLVKTMYSSGGYCVKGQMQRSQQFCVCVKSTREKILLTCLTVFKKQEM
jgi:hypothetical protein